MTNIVLLPSVLTPDGSIRLANELRECLERGEDPGSRKIQIQQLDAMLGRAIAELQKQIVILEGKNTKFEELKTLIFILTGLVNSIRNMARAIS